jgi:hypothetical protein
LSHSCHVFDGWSCGGGGFGRGVRGSGNDVLLPCVPDRSWSFDCSWSFFWTLSSSWTFKTLSSNFQKALMLRCNILVFQVTSKTPLNFWCNVITSSSFNSLPIRQYAFWCYVIASLSSNFQTALDATL